MRASLSTAVISWNSPISFPAIAPRLLSIRRRRTRWRSVLPAGSVAAATSRLMVATTTTKLWAELYRICRRIQLANFRLLRRASPRKWAAQATALSTSLLVPGRMHFMAQPSCLSGTAICRRFRPLSTPARQSRRSIENSTEGPLAVPSRKTSCGGFHRQNFAIRMQTSRRARATSTPTPLRTRLPLRRCAIYCCQIVLTII